MIPTLPYSQELVFATQTASSLAKAQRHPAYSGGHLLQALLHEEVGLSYELEAWGIDVGYLKEWAEVRVSNMAKSMQSSDHPPGDEKVRKALEVADMVRLKLGLTQVTPLCALAALARPDVAFTADQLRTLPLTEHQLLALYAQSAPDLPNPASPDKPQTRPAAKGGAQGTIAKYCTDKTALAREGRTDPIIGRDGEVRMMMEILSRRTKPNVMILGEPGVGKTALVEGFALKIVQEQVPPPLRKATVLELDLGSLVAGASYKGEVEDRLKKIIQEVKQLEKAILFIDEIHMLLDPRGSVGSGAANLLKPDLARGELTVIGATTNDEYRKYIEKDEAFSRRFEVLRVEEPDDEAAVRMLQAILPKYEKHHALQVVPAALEEAVGMARRYLRERSLPDTAVDLMDRTMAAIRLMREGSEEVIAALQQELAGLAESQSSRDGTGYYKELRWFETQMRQRLSPILLGRIAKEEEESAALDSPEALKRHLEEKLQQAGQEAQQPVQEVVPAHIASIVSYATGIPLGKIQSQEREKLLQMEDLLAQRVIGQQQALQTVSEAVRIARSGIKEPGKPVGSFFFLGPTGTGKTELAKALSALLFNDEQALIRFDMSEFKEEHSVSALIGAPAGYVGYEEGGALVNRIRKQPYAIVLFDEIEKAHRSVFDIFLQILDEGRLSDKLGKEGDFTNAIILFTSNIGSDLIAKYFQEGKALDEKTLKDLMKPYFRPEFLARVSSMIPFSPITEEMLMQIFRIHLGKLVKLLKQQGLTLSVSPAAAHKVAQEGFDPAFGARPLISEIRNQLSKPISRMLIEGKAAPGNCLEADVNEAGEIVWHIS